ncbi:STAS domain-containing protein [Chloroflexales bacterium ZM16-3]|nr:STAS domain-containing protein [Chloroflexales bacterium ZM16-3]
MQLDTHIYAYLSDLVLICDRSGTIRLANPAAQRHVSFPLVGQPFAQLLSPDSAAKCQHFLEAVQAATPDAPTAIWELTMGNTDDYIIATFRGYSDGDETTIIGQVEPPHVSQMQRELLSLTSELTEAQREQRRQNRQLQHALEEQRRMFETINELTVPAVPIWSHVLLLPMVGHMDSHRAEQITSQLLERVSREHAAYVILDISGISVVDTAVAQQLIQTAQALRLLGVQPILVGINPEIAQTIVNLGLELTGFVVHADLRSAMGYLMRRLGLIARPYSNERNR